MVVVIGLFVFFVVLLVIGVVWVLVEGMNDLRKPGSVLIAEERLRKQNKKTHVQIERSVGLWRLGAMLRSGQWRWALPWLLTATGLFGVVIMVGPLLWYTVERWVAYVWMAAVVASFARMGWQFVHGFPNRVENRDDLFDQLDQ